MEQLYNVIAIDKITHVTRRVIEHGKTKAEAEKICTQLYTGKPAYDEYYSVVVASI